MAKYTDDRQFTDYVHRHLATPLIYKNLNWTEKNVDADALKSLDLNDGIDYVFQNQKGEDVRIQERFRDNFYQKYSDCTLRFRREHNADATRRASEFFKIKADYLIYGITNGSKWLDKRATLTDFLKFVVVDLRVLFQKMDNQQIVLQTGSASNFSRIEGGKMTIPINQNPDFSSSFVALFQTCHA